jgi:hypothetical protein
VDVVVVMLVSLAKQGQPVQLRVQPAISHAALLPIVAFLHHFIMLITFIQGLSKGTLDAWKCHSSISSIDALQTPATVVPPTDD